MKIESDKTIDNSVQIVLANMEQNKSSGSSKKNYMEDSKMFCNMSITMLTK